MAMAMSELAVEAKEAAARELAKLLPLPDSLASIPALRADYTQRHQANDAQLSTGVMTQVDEARAGIDALAKAQASIAELRQNFVTIEKLCAECEILIDNHEQIKLLSNARNNLATTLKDVEGMMSISVKAAEARASLSNDKELVNTYERLSALEGKRRFALAAASSHQEEAGKLREYFDDVSRTKVTFEQTLWGYIRDFHRLGKESPQTLVRALRVVEMQEALDRQLAEEEAESGSSGLRSAKPAGAAPLHERTSDKGYKDRAYDEISKVVDDRFSDLLTRLVQEDLPAALEEASAIAAELSDVYDYVAPCFPPRYQIFQFVVQVYTRHFVQMLQRLGDRADSLTNIEILKVIAWLDRYEEQMLQLGIDEAIVMMPAESGSLDALMNVYVHRMKSTMKQWYTNILEHDKTEPPKKSEDGKMWTPAPTDLFRILGEQIALVQENSAGVMLFKTGATVVQVMLDFQDAERMRFKEPVAEVGLEALCAMVNNNIRCHDLAAELSNTLVDSLDPRYAEQLDIEAASNGFLDVAKEAVTMIVEVIFDDPGVKDLLNKLYQAEWHEALVTEYLAETFRDYFADVKQFVEDRSFRHFAEACLDRSVLVYIDRLLLQKSYINEAMIERLKLDEDVLAELFKESINEAKFEKRLQPMADLRELASSDSVEAVTLVYTNLLNSHPDCTPFVVERLMALREDIPKKEAKEVVAECRDVYNSMLANKPPSSKGLFSQLTLLRKR
eukprot:SM000347S12999  [mRNA]  locus=s347:8276:14393:- [translate_table: standard]